MKEIMLCLVGIALIVFAVLEIILFFKIWRMTNDIKKVSDTILANGYPSGVSPAKIEFALGNTEKAKEMVQREFLFAVSHLYLKVNANKVISEQQEYARKFGEIEKEYKERYENVSSYIEFSKYATFENAQKIFQ